MAGLNGCELQTRSYDTNVYSFRPALARMAYERYGPTDWERDEPGPLEALHELHAWLNRMGLNTTDLSQVHTRDTDQTSQHYTDLYFAFHDLRPAFRSTYLSFVEGVVQPLFDETVVYQTVPTLRVHMPGNVAVGEYHTDAKYGHPAEAVNFWVPVTGAHDTNALYIQTSEDDMPRARNANYGEYLIFDGVGLPHGNERNTTGQTRVSFDFRVMPESQFNPSDETSINTGLVFRTGEGGYYSLLDDDSLAAERERIAEASRPTREWEERLNRQWAEEEERANREPAERLRRLLRAIRLLR